MVESDMDDLVDLVIFLVTMADDDDNGRYRADEPLHHGNVSRIAPNRNRYEVYGRLLPFDHCLRCSIVPDCCGDRFIHTDEDDGGRITRSCILLLIMSIVDIIDDHQFKHSKWNRNGIPTHTHIYS